MLIIFSVNDQKITHKNAAAGEWTPAAVIFGKESEHERQTQHA